MRKIVSLILPVILVAGLAGGCTKEEKAAGVNDVAPAFSLPDLTGRSVSLASLKGHVVLLEFWATWCPPCREAAPGIEKIYTEYLGKGVMVLGISLDSDDRDAVETYVREFGITYPVLMGTEEVAQQYLVRTIPIFILVDKEGKVRQRYLGSGNEDSIEEDIRSLLAG